MSTKPREQHKWSPCTSIFMDPLLEPNYSLLFGVENRLHYYSAHDIPRNPLSSALLSRLHRLPPVRQIPFALDFLRRT